MRERGRVGAVYKRGWSSLPYDLDGKARGAVALVIGGVCVVIGKVKVRWDVGFGLGSEAE